MRALAVLLIAVFHTRTSLVPGGFIGVDIFFVLSGFLITRILIREVGTTGRISLRNFYVRRALRLFPALALACGLILSMNLLVPQIPGSHGTVFGTLAAITYTSTWLLAFDVADLGAMVPTWSLAVEEHFYLLWPLLFILACRLRIGRMAATLGLTGLAIAYSCIAPAFFGWSEARSYYAPDTRASQLLIGCSLAFVLPAIHRRIPMVWALLSSLPLVAFAMFKDRLPFEIYDRGGSVVIALMAAVIIAHLATCERSVAARLLSIRPMVWIGQRSYGIYLWNLPVIAMMAFLGSSTPALCLKLLLCFVIPALSYRFVEKPFLRMKDRFGPQAKRSVGSSNSGVTANSSDERLGLEGRRLPDAR